MSFFAPKKHNILGIDIGAGGIKLVEFRHAKHRPELHTYAFTDRVAAEVDHSLIDDPAAAAALAQKMMKQAKTTTMRAVAGLPIASVFSSILSVPATSGKELKAAIEWQARKLIPLPLEEMVLDWRVLDHTKHTSSAGLVVQPETKSIFTQPGKGGPPELTGKKSMRVLLTGAAKSLITKYMAFAKAAGLELVALETEAFALIRSLVGKDTSSIMVVDFGTVRSSIMVVEHGVPVITRTITLGGVTLTRTISRTLGVPDDQSEQMKRDIKNLGGGALSTDMPGLLGRVIEPLVTEIRYSLELYRKQQGEARTVDKIVLTGGSAHLPNLAAYLSKTLNLNTYVGDPWARVGTHEDLRPVLDDIGPRFAVAIGLAMRDFE